MRLFADDSGSPVPQQWEDDEITAVITPYSKVDNSFDSGFKSNRTMARLNREVVVLDHLDNR